MRGCPTRRACPNTVSPDIFRFHDLRDSSSTRSSRTPSSMSFVCVMADHCSSTCAFITSFGIQSLFSANGLSGCRVKPRPPFAAPLFQGLGLHPSGPHPFGAHLVVHNINSTSKNWQKSKLAEVEKKTGRSRTRPAKTGRDQNRSLPRGTHPNARTHVTENGQNIKNTKTEILAKCGLRSNH